jgi:hypothetical protein
MCFEYYKKTKEIPEEISYSRIQSRRI